MDDQSRSMTVIRVLSAAFCASLAVATACQDQSGRRATEITDSASVRIVSHADVDRQLEWQFIALWEIGGANDSRLPLVELGSHQVAVGSEGNVLVLDEAGSRVLVISKEGELVRTIGRPGEGPGELGMPTALAVDRHGTVAVYDLGRRSIVRWDASGSLLPEVRITAPFWGPKIRTVAEDTAVFTALPDVMADSDHQVLLAWSPDATQTLARLVRPADVLADFPTCGYFGIAIPPIFAPELVWDETAGRIALNVWPEYRIDVLDEGETMLSIRRAMPMREVDRSDALQEVADGLPITVVDCTVPAEEVVRGRGYVDVLPAIADVAFAPTGDLWVTRGRVRGEDRIVDIYSADGSYTGTLPANSPFPAAFLSNGEFVAIELDEHDVPRLVLYHISS